MTDPRSALERLTRWLSDHHDADSNGYMSVRVADPRATLRRLRDFADNPAANGMVPVRPETLRDAADTIEGLLSTVEQMREAMKNLNDIRNGEGGTLRVDPETGWPLAWGEFPAAPTEEKP